MSSRLFFYNLNISNGNTITNIGSGNTNANLNITGNTFLTQNVTIGSNVVVNGPVLQIPSGNIASRPITPQNGSIRYNTETSQFEGYGPGGAWGSLGGVIDIAQTTKILASGSPSTTDGNLYFLTTGTERMRINSSGNIGIGTSVPSFTLDVNGNARISSGITVGNLEVITLGDITHLTTTTATLPNIIATNISSATLTLSTGITAESAQITNINVTSATVATLSNTNTITTNVSSATAQITNLNATTSTIATLLNTNLTSTNISSTTLTISTGLTSATAQITNLNATTSTIATLLNTNTITTNISSATLNSSTINSNLLSATTITGGNLSLSGNVNIAGTLTVVNITATNLMDTNLTAGIVRITSNLAAVGTSNTIGSIFTTDGNVGINTTNPLTRLHINGNSLISGDVTIGSNMIVTGPVLQIPTGNIASRPGTPQNGSVRYNTETSQFEGYGPGGAWGSLGGVIDIAQTTKILASETPSTTDGNLYFLTTNIERMRINSAGNIGIGTTAPSVLLDVLGSARFTNLTLTNSTISNIASTNVNSSNITTTNLIATNFTASNFVANNVNYGISSAFSGSFSASNNVNIPTNITGFNFANSNTRSFQASVTVSILRSSGGNLYQNFVMDGFQTDSGWSLYISKLGDETGLVFNITSDGQIQYQSTNITNFTSNIIRFSILQISNTGSYSSVGNLTQGTLLLDSIQISNTQNSIIGTNPGSLHVLGGSTLTKTVNILTTENSVGLGTGGGISVLGGGAISKDLYVGGTITTGNLEVIGLTDTFNLTVTNITSGTINSTNIITSNITLSSNLIALGNSNTIGNIFTTGGNIGIGTMTPTARLHLIGGGIRINSGLTNTSTRPTLQTTVSSYEIRGSSADGDQMDDGFLRLSAGGGTNVANQSAIELTGFSTLNEMRSNIRLISSGTERMRIASTGNVGIGTTSPQQTLHVSGNVLINNGNLRVSGRVEIVNRRPLFMSGGTTFSLTTTPQTIASVYGPYEYAANQTPVANGATRQYRIYAVYSDDIQNGVSWILRITNGTTSIDYSMDPTYGGATASRDFISSYSVNKITTHGTLQIFGQSGQSPNPNSILIMYIELQTLDVYS